MHKVVEEYGDIFTSPTGVTIHYQVQDPIDLTLGESLPITQQFVTIPTIPRPTH